MNLNLLKNKKIAILGLGLENLALVRYLLKHKVNCEITVCDARKNFVGAGRDLPVQVHACLPNWRELPLRKNIHWQLGKNYNKNLDKFDVLFRAPGWPIDCPGIVEAQKKKFPLPPFVKGGKCNPPACRARHAYAVKRAGAGRPNPLYQGSRMLSSPMKLFFELCPTKNIIGVTGTKGKGTTASLIYQILKKGFERATTNGAHTNEKIKKRVWLGGNIGVVPFEFLDKIRKNDWVVLELSSFQLEDMMVSPRIAVITNFYSEHLAPADPNNPNYHKSMKEYWNAKTNIFRWQKSGDYLISNYQLPISKQIPNSKSQNTKKINSKIIYFKKSELPSKLIGEHNKENIAAAVAVAKIVGVKQEIINQAVADFKGLEHRLELVREYQGVKYYDDSFATTPEATIIALKSFTAPIILLLGGADKGADFNELAKDVKKQCKFVVLLNGKATPRIKKELFKIGYENNKMKLVNNIKDAVIVARQRAGSGDVILLSTACASFGMFKNYKERGKLFKAEVIKY